MARIFGLAIYALIVSCAPSSPLLDMQAGEQGRVVKIIDGDALILESGQSVRLVSILAPVLSPRDRPPERYAGESARTLEDLALGRRVQLYYPGLTRDRYDRALAHVVTIDAAGPQIWLNQEMLARGAARVRLYSSTAARGQDLLAAEDTARDAKRGLWALADYQTLDAEIWQETQLGFREIAATLAERQLSTSEERYAPACVWTLEGTLLTLRVTQDAAAVCGLRPGTNISVRGWISPQAIELNHPWHWRLP
ncbi:MAG: thermonuclease family protein [Pseudomonadota bacterium]